MFVKFAWDWTNVTCKSRQFTLDTLITGSRRRAQDTVREKSRRIQIKHYIPDTFMGRGKSTSNNGLNSEDSHTRSRISKLHSSKTLPLVK